MIHKRSILSSFFFRFLLLSEKFYLFYINVVRYYSFEPVTNFYQLDVAKKCMVQQSLFTFIFLKKSNCKKKSFLSADKRHKCFIATQLKTQQIHK